MDGPLFRWLLRLLPRDFRERNADEMEEIARALVEGGRPADRFGARLALAADIVLMSVRLRISGGRTGRGVRSIPRHGSPVAPLGCVAGDLSFAVRALRMRPGFAVVTALVLGLGIGAMTTIFSVVDGVLLRPLPYAAADRIGILWHHHGLAGHSLPAVNPRDVWDYREWSEVIEEFTYGTGGDRLLSVDGRARIVNVGAVAAGFFDFFGHEPALGRGIRPEDDLPGAAPVMVLSHRAWTEHFAGAPDAIGRTVSLGPSSYRVVGVMTPDFRLVVPAEALFLKDADVWVPTGLSPNYSGTRSYVRYTAFARIREGATFADAQEEVDRMAARLRRLAPEHEREELRAEVLPLQADVVKHVRPTIQLLMGAVALILLVSCLNVSGLLAARGKTRDWELSVRAAVGAGAGRLFGLVFLESVVLASVGCLLGLALARLGLLGIARLSVESVPRIEGVGVNGRVAAFAAATAFVAAVLAGLAPAIRAAHGSPARVLAGTLRSTRSRAGVRSRDLLVAAQVGASVVLLVAAGLVTRSFAHLHAVDPGYDARDVQTFRVSFPRESYPDAAARRLLYRQVAEALEGLPWVTSVAAVSQVPLTGQGYAQGYAYDERTAAAFGTLSADGRWITPGFFETIGARLVAGREFTDEELESGDRVVIIDDRLAREAFPDGDAVGRHLQTSPGGGTHEVVGVVQHLRIHDLTRPVLTQLYAPMRFDGEWSGREYFSVVVRVTDGEADLAGAAEAAMARLAPGAVVQDVVPLRDLVARARASARLALVLMLLFGGTAVVLASVGLFGVISLTVGERRKEIGIRVALGEGRASIQRLVVGRGMLLVTGAVVAGLLAALVLTRYLRPILFSVPPADAVTYLVVTLLVTGCALLACWLPARATTRIDPCEALRIE